MRAFPPVATAIASNTESLDRPRNRGRWLLDVRRETGKEAVVQVHYDEGVATHIGPKPCAVVQQGRGEASAGERIGQPLSRERTIIPGADAVSRAEGNTDGHVEREARTARRGRRPWHVRTLLAREPGDPTSGRHTCGGPHREGEEP